MSESERERERGRATSDEDARGNTGGTGAGAAANATDRTGVEGATMARSAGGEFAGSAAPEPVPNTADAQGHAASAGDLPSREKRIPEEPAPGVIREPGPEAES